MKQYDAAAEHKPFERSAQAPKDRSRGAHPNKGLKGKNPYSGVELKEGK